VRIALIKTSSMGDVIHALPVVTDLVSARPDVVIDWVVEEAFADLPALHPSVNAVIPVAIRRWRRSLTRAATWHEIRAVREQLRANRYDLALDLQGLLKSAVVARWTGAPIAGFDRGSARELLAALLYAQRFPVSWDLHAIERLRSLAAQALDLRLEERPRFDLKAVQHSSGTHPDPLAWLPAQRYVVLLHATSRPEKLWPESHWVELGQELLRQGIMPVLPWGSVNEQSAAHRLVEAIGSAKPGFAARVAPRMSLRECAQLLSGAEAVVGVDTGLTHLSAALDRPTVALFAATEAWRYGPYWTDRAISLGSAGQWPTAQQVLSALNGLTAGRSAQLRPSH
jgi:heptosyltransferase-1